MAALPAPVPPHLERRRCNRRRRELWLGFHMVRHRVLRVLEVAQDRDCASDRRPVPVVRFPLVPGAGREWAAQAAAVGVGSSKQQWTSGYTLPVLVPVGGVLLAFALAPANAPEAQVGAALLADHQDLLVVGAKGYRHAGRAATLQSVWGGRG